MWFEFSLMLVGTQTGFHWLLLFGYFHTYKIPSPQACPFPRIRLICTRSAHHWRWTSQLGTLVAPRGWVKQLCHAAKQNYFSYCLLFWWGRPQPISAHSLKQIWTIACTSLQHSSPLLKGDWMLGQHFHRVSWVVVASCPSQILWGDATDSLFPPFSGLYYMQTHSTILSPAAQGQAFH